MAGSYNHVVTDAGDFCDNESFVGMIGNLGDAYEMAEEMYGMIWYLVSERTEPRAAVERARLNYKVGRVFASHVEKEKNLPNIVVCSHCDSLVVK
jgi:hypothetical protein